MAILNVAEYDRVSILPNGTMAPGTTLRAPQDVAVGASSAQSTEFTAGTKFVRLCADVDCRVLFGSNPTALLTSVRVVANSEQYYEAPATMKVAVIAE